MRTNRFGHRQEAHDLFLAIKIIHELSHLVHLNVGEKLFKLIVPTALGGKGKRKRSTAEKGKGDGENAAVFGDFGEMVEYDITSFGAVLPEARRPGVLCRSPDPVHPSDGPAEAPGTDRGHGLPDHRRPARAAPRRSPRTRLPALQWASYRTRPDAPVLCKRTGV
jgi:hypothetical protein